MAILRSKQIREMNSDERKKKLSELSLELFKEMGNVKMGRPVKNSGKIKELKRTISRMITIEKEIRKEVKK